MTMTCEICWEHIADGEPRRMIEDSTFVHEECLAEEEEEG